MKKDIHPDYHEVTIVMTNGKKFKTRSTWGKEGDSITLDVDPLTHPAWTGTHKLIESSSQLAKFRDRFSGFGIE